MSFDWGEYVRLAELLLSTSVEFDGSDREARLRSAVSRAYYAAFIQARNRLRDFDHFTIPVTANPHQFVSNAYLRHSDAERGQIGADLRRLRIDRNQCDYDDTVAGLEVLTGRSLHLATRVLATLARLPGS